MKRFTPLKAVGGVVTRGFRKVRSHKLFRTLSLKNIILVGLAVGLLFASIIFVWIATFQIPTLDGFEARSITQSTKIYDRTGEILLFDLHEDIRRTVVPLDKVSRNLKNATIAIEDAEFYEHRGIKPTAILRAVFANIRNVGFSQGGSTITQQVVKNTLLTREKTIKRKLKEWILALRLERILTKDQILELYLNEVPYGGNIYGAEEAARHYFSVSAYDLSLAQAAYLAALPQAPSRYSPYGNNIQLLEARKNLVLRQMVERGFITTQEYETAKADVVTFEQYGDTNIKAPHFVFYVSEYLEEKYGRDAVYESGMKVITTLNYDLQKIGEDVVSKFAYQNEKDFNAENAALVAIDPKTGQILTMVGSRNYFDEEIDGKFNVATAYRQPGSTFKPIIYSAAFEKGYTPETVVFDVPTQFSTTCAPSNFSSSNGCYSPGNYDNIFRGPMTFRNALAQSINIPAVKALHLVGVNKALDTARAMGITTLDKGRGFYGLPLVLGGGEVSPLELTSAYSVLANDGVRHPHTAILRVEDIAGTVLEEYEDSPGERVLSSQTARLTASILTDIEARIPAYGQNSFSFGAQQVAIKTGTTNNYRDVWIMGYTPTIAVATWGGNNDNSPIVKRVAGFVLAPLWRSYMDQALAVVPRENFKAPAPEPNPGSLKPVLRGFWQGTSASSTAPSVHSILHWVNRNDPRGPIPTNPASDPQYSLWEYGVRIWAAENAPQLTEGAGENNGNGDTSENPNTVPNTMLRILTPSASATYPTGQVLTIAVSAPQDVTLTNVDYYLNGAFMGGSTQAPYSLSIVPSSQGPNTLRAVGKSTRGDNFEAETSFITQ